MKRTIRGHKNIKVRPLIVKNTVWFQLKHVENGNMVHLIDVKKSVEGLKEEKKLYSNQTTWSHLE